MEVVGYLVMLHWRIGIHWSPGVSTSRHKVSSGQFCPNGPPSAEDERSCLHQLIAMATLAREKIEAAKAEVPLTTYNS